ncbi:Panacea domain-containing protein [Marinoscillum sp. MHG1-6]|uniref:Panacea domain-containing protein n=1 Tax=Marinoscillum sp. MHG1-6 TaxID=2959627 RepID=UPI0021579898|nr:type II toxin-antitoxin system antitoxin SocA domain-containing protein [Marinoscillum sp. MHG1-6]
MYKASTLAHFFVYKSQRTQIPVTPHKIEFMVYFAHGWHLAIDGRPLILEEVKAWRHGPVVASVHKFYSKNSRNIYGTLKLDEIKSMKTKDLQFLEGIWMYYSHLNEVEMLSLCLESGTPWNQTYEKSSNELTIENSIIEQHYRLLHLSNPNFADIDDPISVVGE